MDRTDIGPRVLSALLVLGAGAGAGAVLCWAALGWLQRLGRQTDGQTNDLDRRAGQGRQAGRTRSDCLHCSLASKVTAAIGDLEDLQVRKRGGEKKDGKEDEGEEEVDIACMTAKSSNSTLRRI